MPVKNYLFIVIFAFFGSINGQSIKYKLLDSLNFVDQNLNPLNKATSGGYHCPQFSTCDLDGDGKKDIVIYDKLDGSISTYINKGNFGEINYKLDNRYASYFPKMRPFGWMLMRDYNNDGYEDIFTIGDQGYIVYKNISYTVSGRPAFVLTEQLQYRNMFPKGSFIEFNSLSTPSIHLPGIYDIDGDGDLDIMSYSNVGGAIQLYLNAQVEKGLPSDSMRFFQVDLCWGYFLDFDCNGYLFNECRANSNRNYDLSRHTAGSSITLYDADNDGDIDLLLGNEGCSHMTLIKNAKTLNSRGYDSFFVADTLFVNANNRASVAIYPAGYFLDIDNDGIRDMIYAPNSVNNLYITKEMQQIKWFKNTGADNFPIWAQQEVLFTNDFIDNGNRSSWAAADWDKDGDLDLICATNGDKLISKDTADRIYLYENIGTSKSPKFILKNQDFGNLRTERIINLTIEIADMDNDGKLDLVCGNEKGEIMYYKNTSNTNSTLSPTFTFSNTTFPGFNIDIGSYSAPAVADINKDGLLDLVIGRNDSMISYYRNSGTLTNPDFMIVTNRFGNVKPIDSIGFQYIYDDTFAVIGYYPVFEKYVHSKPRIADLNGDGKLELIVGNSLGTLRLYEIDGTAPNSTFKNIDSFVYQKLFQGQINHQLDFGSFISPCLADLDGDTVPEILVSINRGGIMYLTPDFKYSHNINIKDISKSIQINGYPNPTSNKIEFNINPDDLNSLYLINTLGQSFDVILNTQSTVLSIDTELLNSGFYIIQFKTKDQKSFTSKFQVIK
ncbi:MAG: FG-GAP-like repeat-containing protein [Bacteroidota bacterium]|nr:FG-GAP-like repeat-containing protein [Bacteroidota bacterium]